MKNEAISNWENDFSDIAKYEVSEDGVAWRPFEPDRDGDKLLHKRIEFAPIDDAA